ncbi:MAG: ATP-binding protein, partial [Betaproteobacteria bacterium]
VSVQKVFRQVLEDLMPLAERKRLDIGVSGTDDVIVAANEMDVGTLVKNLVDNAIRYTPNHGRIDLVVRIEGDKAVLQVSDTGPGIPQQERERVFEAFYRTLETGETGSGLGLSIVKAIADRIQAQVQLSETDEVAHTGLRVQVVMPIGSSRS